MLGSVDFIICNFPEKINYFILIFNNFNNFDQYQLGFVCASKAYTKAFITNDINISNTNYIFNPKCLSEGSITEFITAYYNYYNVPFGQCNKGGYITSSNAVYPYDIPFFNKYNNSGKIDLQVGMETVLCRYCS